MRPLLYRGKRVECPICGAKYRKFLPFGRPVRKNALCPKCGSLERHRRLYLYLREKTGIFKERAVVLHFAPERGLSTVLSSHPKLQYVSTDFEMPQVAVRSDITMLPFETGTFDYVLCCDVLEHVPRDIDAMGELRRVLKQSGCAILRVPLNGKIETDEDLTVTDPVQRRARYGQEDHVRYYGDNIVDRLESVGFRVSMANSMKEFVGRHGLSSEILYVCQP